MHHAGVDGDGAAVEVGIERLGGDEGLVLDEEHPRGHVDAAAVAQAAGVAAEDRAEGAREPHLRGGHADPPPRRQFVGPGEDVGQPVAVELVHREDVPAGHAVGGAAVAVQRCFQLIKIEQRFQIDSIHLDKLLLRPVTSRFPR